MNCNYKVKITDIQNKYQFKILCKGGANSTNVNDIYNLLPTTTNENTNITISNTADIKAKSITIKGNTSQETTTGKNLWGGASYIIGTLFKTNVNGTIDVILNNQDGISAVTTQAVQNGLVKTLKAGTYTFSATGLDNGYLTAQIVKVNSSTSGEVFQNLTNVTTAKTFTLTEDIEYFIRLQTVQPITYTGTVYLQLESGNTATEWEQYTNGASPNPSYPQDIINVTGLNTITVSNSDNSISKDFIINFGDLEFCKIGTYQDYLYKENNKWYKHKAIEKTTLNGSETPTLSTTSTNTTRAFYRDILPYNAKAGAGSGICNLLRYYVNWDTDVEGFYFDNNTTNLVFRINKSTVGTTITSVNNFLSENNMTVYYILATAIDEEITDTTLIKQLNNISNNIRTFEGSTNISSTSAGANPIINITTFNKLS